jgi:hypothetical protein
MLRKLCLAALTGLFLPFTSAHAGVNISFGFAPPPCRPRLLPLPRPYLSLYFGPSSAPIYAPPAPEPVFVQPAPLQPAAPPPPVLYSAPRK